MDELEPSRRCGDLVFGGDLFAAHPCELRCDTRIGVAHAGQAIGRSDYGRYGGFCFAGLVARTPHTAGLVAS